MRFLVILSILLEGMEAKTFVFGASTRFTHLKNWLNQDYPCQGDRIIFEQNKKTVTFVDENVQVTSMLLPDVGAIIFSDDSVLGEKSRWQCTHRKSPENVFFQSDSEFAGFSDPSTWLPDDKPLLHMNMVPGANIKSSMLSLVIYTQQYSFAGTLSDKCVLPATPHPVEQHDDVIFHDMGAFQISIDDQVTVNSLRMSRDWVSQPVNVAYVLVYLHDSKITNS